MEEHVTEEWHSLLTGGKHGFFLQRPVLKRLPSAPRCKLCNAPFSGAGGFMMRRIGKAPSGLNPNFCAMCEKQARKRPGGAEIELSMLFADVRGSTTLAESLGTAAFTQLINRFFITATNVLVDADALMTRLVGDEVIALFLPRLLKEHHAEIAVKTATQLLEATGHKDPDGPWVPLGAGVHTGMAFVGVVGAPGGILDFTALGDEVNVTARLASSARAGELLISEAARVKANLETRALAPRRLQLKGRVEPVDVWTLHIGAQQEN